MASDADSVAVSTMFENLYKLYKENNNCDLMLVSGDKVKFNTHSFLICAAIPKLRDTIIENSKNNIMKLRVREVRGRLLELVIQYAYLGKCDLNEMDSVTLIELIKAASHLQMAELENEILQSFKKCLCMESALKVHADKSPHLAKAAPTAEAFILRHLLDALPPGIAFEDLLTLLADDRLHTSHEEKVCLAILNWISADPEKRSNCLVPLLGTVRFGFLPPEFIEKIVNHPLVMTNTAALKLMEEAITITRSYQVPCTEMSKNPLPLEVRPRIPHISILAFGGWRTGEEVCAIAEVYDMNADNWTPVATLKIGQPRSYHRAEAIGDYVYIVGGSDREQSLRTGLKLNPSTHIWSPISPMHHGRCFVSTAVLDGILYAFGGREFEHRLKSAEAYDPKTDLWTKIPHSIQTHSDAAAAGLDGKIYLVGGFNGAEVLSTLECFSPDTSTWTILPSMSRPRSGLACVAHKGRLFVFGGFDGNTRLSDGECYNPNTGIWTPLAPMKLARSTFQLVRVGDVFYAIGGYSEHPESAVEAYDSIADKWYIMRSLLQPTSAMACVAVDNLVFSESLWPRFSRSDPSSCLRDFRVDSPPYHTTDEPLPEGTPGMHHPGFLEPLPVPWSDLFNYDSVSEDDTSFSNDVHFEEHHFDDSDFSSDLEGETN
ncbi:Hypothetical predicted protein [Cloeon dipterum]|uniref:Kelch-like protein diablo n=1 Tax=Cloeon dipterum TaxID=197152 RepID=A0A8S1CML7_9INSE|nr:Hypothetical predicted protein [Cloeon dipterum]